MAGNLIRDPVLVTETVTVTETTPDRTVVTTVCEPDDPGEPPPDWKLGSSGRPSGSKPPEGGDYGSEGGEHGSGGGDYCVAAVFPDGRFKIVCW